MKNIFKTILCIASFIIPAYSVFAQEQVGEEQYVPDKYHYQNDDHTGLVYSKEVQGPNAKGEYTIFLKSFVTGKADEETIKIPSEIVLVLDVSGSMRFGMSDTDFTSAGKSFTPNDIANAIRQKKDLMYRWGKDDYYRVNYEESDYYDYYYAAYFSIDGTKYYFTQNGELTTDSSKAYYCTANQTVVNNRTLYTVIDTDHTRLAYLKDAVNFFISEIKKDNINNKVALVKFASEYYPGQASTSTNATGNNTDYSGNNYSEIVNGFLSCTNSQLTTNVNNLASGGATAADRGMIKAKALINSLYKTDKITPNENTNKIVVFFTDGEPTYSSIFQDEVANSAVSAAKDIKSLTSYTITTKSGQTFSEKVRVYTIGTFAKPSQKVKTYMNRLSSNFPNATGIGTGQEGTGGSESYGYTFMASDQESLKKAFGKISSAVALPDITVDASSTVVDVMSKSFTLPAGTDASTVQVWETDATGYDETNHEFTFSTDKKDWNNITDVPELLDTDPETNKVTVTGWPFDKNACAQKTDKTVMGKQLILEIPIEMGPSAVGGPGVGTNGSGSGISYKDENNNPQTLLFDTPNIGLPVNLHIRKEGLKKGESAKFKIQRMWDGKAKIPDDVVIEANTWQDYTSVFVTRRSTDTETGEKAPLVKIVGLHPGFTYRIIEEDWSWSYGLTQVHGKKYVINPETQVETISEIEMSNGSSSNDWEGNTVLSTSINMNPFIFVNAKKAVEVEDGVTSVRHAESIVRNEFSKATSGSTSTGASEYSKEQPTK